MKRHLGVVAVLLLWPLTVWADAPDPAGKSRPPEALLARESLAYFRFDGLEPHRRAYESSALAQAMEGDLRDFLDHIGGLVQNAIGHGVVKDKMMAGLPPEQLLRIHGAAGHLPRLPQYLNRQGFLLGFEMVSVLPPRAQLTLVFPHGGAAGDREALFAAFQLVCALNNLTVQSVNEEQRSISQVDLGDSVHLAWWQEAEHVVCTVGTEKPAHTLELVRGKRPNLTSQPLFRAVQDFDRYETVARGFIDLEGILKRIRPFGPFVGPPVAKITQVLGVDGLKSLTLHVGFAGRLSRSTLTLHLTEERKGLLRLASAPAGWTPGPFPPIAPDASSVIVLHLDAATVYDVTREIAEGITKALEPGKLPEVEKGLKKIDEALGIDLRKDLLGSLGSRVVLYNSPGEGFMGLGFGLAVEVKDPVKLRASLDTLFRSLPGVLETRVDLRKRTYRGVDVYTVHLGERRFGLPLAPTWAIHQGWLTFGLYPQTAHGFILRAGGKHAVWKPTPLLDEVLAEARKKPTARVLALTQSDPRRPLTDLAAFSPIFTSAMSNNDQEGDFDIARIPNFQAMTEPLFPNVGVLVDEGDSLRLETYSSLGLPFDALGLETYWFPLLVFGNLF